MGQAICEITYMEYVNVVCEIYIFLRYIFRTITYLGWSHIQMKYKFQKNIHTYSQWIHFHTRIESCHLDRTLTNARVKLRAKVGERHENDEEGS